MAPLSLAGTAVRQPVRLGHAVHHRPLPGCQCRFKGKDLCGGGGLVGDKGIDPFFRPVSEVEPSHGIQEQVMHL